MIPASRFLCSSSELHLFYINNYICLPNLSVPPAMSRTLCFDCLDRSPVLIWEKLAPILCEKLDELKTAASTSGFAKLIRCNPFSGTKMSALFLTQWKSSSYTQQSSGLYPLGNQCSSYWRCCLAHKVWPHQAKFCKAPEFHWAHFPIFGPPFA